MLNKSRFIDLYFQDQYYWAVQKNQDPQCSDTWILIQFKGCWFFKIGNTHRYSIKDFICIDPTPVELNTSTLTKSVNKDKNTNLEIRKFLMNINIESKKYPVVTWGTIFNETSSGANSGYVFRIISSDFISFDAYSTWRIVGIKDGPQFKYDIFWEKRKASESDFSFDIETIVSPVDKEKHTFCLFFIQDMETKSKKLLALPFNEFKSFFYCLEQLDVKDYVFKLESTGPSNPSKYSIFFSKEKRKDLVSFHDMDIDVDHLLNMHFETRSKSFIKLMIQEAKADFVSIIPTKPYLLN